MLHFDTDAPDYVVRAVMSFARGMSEDASWDAPYWVQSTIHVHEDEAMAVLNALRDYRVTRHGKAKVAVADPTFAMAAAVIERKGGGSTPAPAYASR